MAAEARKAAAKRISSTPFTLCFDPFGLSLSKPAHMLEEERRFDKSG
jgi:hypothetical protein